MQKIPRKATPRDYSEVHPVEGSERAHCVAYLQSPGIDDQRKLQSGEEAPNLVELRE